MEFETELTKQSVENEYLLIDMIRYLWGRKLIIGSLTLGVMILVSGIVLLQPNLYSSTASLLPSGDINKASKLSNIIGFGANFISDENSSELYPVVLSSRRIQESVLSKKYSFKNGHKDTSLALADYFEQENIDKLRQSLASITKIKTDPKTGAIFLAVETEYPGLSQVILNSYLEELENYNLLKRNSHGHRTADYLVNQIKEINDNLILAEEKLETYRLANQNWSYTTDPTILKESRRLEREAEILYSRYRNLQKQYESARQEAFNDIPIVGILDNSSLPTIKSGPFRTIKVLLTGMATCFLTIFVMLAKAIYRYKVNDEKNKNYLSLSNEFNQTFSHSRRLLKLKIFNNKNKEHHNNREESCMKNQDQPVA